MYEISKSIDIDFAHHVAGHQGPSINIHGHTWRFEVGLCAEGLDALGFVLDFKELKTKVLQPVCELLDHSLALSEEEFDQLVPELESIGRLFFEATLAPICGPVAILNGAWNEFPGRLKLAIFPFVPTLERLAKWFYHTAKEIIETENESRVKVAWVKVYEKLQPESVCLYKKEE